MRHAMVWMMVLVGAVVALPVVAGPPHGKKGHGQYAQDLSPMKRLKKVERKLLDGAPLSAHQARKLAQEIEEARRALKQEMALLRTELKEWRDHDCVGSGAPVPVAVNVQIGPDVLAPMDAPVEPEIFPMAAADFQSLESTIRDQSFSEDKIGALAQAVGYSYFTVAQVRRLLELYPFPANKLDALRMVAPRILDPENQFQLMNSFVHSSDKESARGILGTPR